MWLYVVQDISEKLLYLPQAAAGAAACVICFLPFCSRERMRQRLPLQAVFLVYFLILVQVTLLEREPGSRTGMDLRIFGTLGDARDNAYVIENLLLFIPYGVMLPLIWKPSQCCFLCVLSGAATSICIELIQMLTLRGYFQVDDMIFNTLGVLCGYLIYNICSKLFGKTQ